MATTTEDQSDAPDGVPEHDRPARRPTLERSDSPPSHWGQWMTAVIVLVALVAGAYVAWQQFGASAKDQAADNALTYTVSRGRLLVTVTEDGNVESTRNVDVKCQVAGGATILWIIEDGTLVEEGELIVKLDESTITDQLNSQRIVYEKALATKIQAEEDFSAAKISVQEYVEGLYIKELSDSEAQIIIALENLRSAENLLEHTQRMARKGFATPLQLEADQFAVQRSQLELDSAKLSKKVLQEFTRAKTLKELESKRDALEAKARSEQAAFDLEKARMERLQAQLSNCIVKAPQRGMVVYANDANRSRFGGSQSPQVEEGAMIREQQALIRLPDLSNMQVKVLIHETKVEQIQAGLRARIVIGDRELMGSVVSVANQPEPTSFFSASVKEYGTTVRIDGEIEGLKPGMTAEVEILIADLTDVITVPVACVVEQRGTFLAWVQTATGPERRPLVLGMTNDNVIEIKDGLKEGDRVLLNPRAFVADARENIPADEEVTTKGFGKAGDSAGAEGQSTPGGAAGGGRGEGGPERGAGGGQGRPSGSAGGGRPGGGGGRGNLMDNDKDGDGKISKDEAPAFMQQFFDRMDANSDGFIDQAEISKARQSRQRSGAGGGRPGGPGGSGGGPGGPGGSGGRSGGNEE